jgi:hypothetical protein
MSKLLSVFVCIVFTLGIIVAGMSEVNQSVVRNGGLRDRAVHWIDQAIP